MGAGTKKQIADTLKTARKKAGFRKLTEASDTLSIPYRTLQSWENGDRTPSKMHLKLITIIYDLLEHSNKTGIDLLLKKQQRSVKG